LKNLVLPFSSQNLKLQDPLVCFHGISFVLVVVCQVIVILEILLDVFDLTKKKKKLGSLDGGGTCAWNLRFLVGAFQDLELESIDFMFDTFYSNMSKLILCAWKVLIV
jgi:hypothetical protein